AYSIQILPRHVKAELSAEFLDYAENAGLNGHAHDRDNLQAIVAYMNAEDRAHLLRDFFERTDQLDRLRGEAIDEVMPEIGQLRAYAGQSD
ncbi:MAG: hypothetical protein ACR2Q4_07900, partial [Geminicoccaceae bacterium]